MKKILSICFILFAVLQGHSQINPLDLQAKLADTNALRKAAVREINSVQLFYLANGYQPVWLTEDGLARYQQLVHLIRNAKEYALDPCDYAAAMIGEEDACMIIADHWDSLVVELRITDAAIRFMSALQFGTAPQVEYDGLHYSPDLSCVPLTLQSAIASNNLNETVQVLGKRSALEQSLLKQLLYFRTNLEKPGYLDVKVTSPKVSLDNTSLVKRLYQLDCISDTSALTDSLLHAALLKSKQTFSLPEVLNLTTGDLSALNIPLDQRAKDLATYINQLRWVESLSMKQPVIIVNIPAASLKVVEKGMVVMNMKLIVGKVATPTPTLTSHVNEVILYPYWVVPVSIITKEVLPALRKNPDYIRSHDFQLLDRNGKAVDPSGINWNNITGKSFPFILRQSTGCDNSLGLLKLNFYNPYTVYLHDTPNKKLFNERKRFFSHGCMRMEHPLELGRMVLGSNRIAIDTLTEKGCLRNQQPIIVAAEKKMAVVVWYQLADTDASGRLVFYDDIYRKREIVVVK